MPLRPRNEFPTPAFRGVIALAVGTVAGLLAGSWWVAAGAFSLALAAAALAGRRG